MTKILGLNFSRLVLFLSWIDWLLALKRKHVKHALVDSKQRFVGSL